MMKNVVHQHYNEIIHNNSNNANSDYYNQNKPSKISFKDAVLTKPAAVVPVKEKEEILKETIEPDSAQLGEADDENKTAGVVAKRKSNRKRRGRGKKNKSAVETEDADDDDEDEADNQKTFDLLKENFPGLGADPTKSEQSDGYSSGNLNKYLKLN
jgi:hypothetical protein